MAEPSALEKLRAIEQRKAVPTESTQTGWKKGAWGTLVGAVVLLLTKFKFVLLFVLTKFKVLLGLFQIAKYGTTSLSMLLTIWVYSGYFGWPYAVGIIGLIFVHELGHGWAARRMGLSVGSPIFIPFVGAMIALRSAPQSAWQEHVVAAGGPWVGGLAALLAVGIGHATSSPLLVAVGYSAVILNMFNLLPVWQFDGARMTRILDSRQRVWVFAGCLGWVLMLTAVTGVLHPIGLLVALLGLGSTWSQRRSRQSASALERLQSVGQLSVASDTAKSSLAALSYAACFALLSVAAAVLQGLASLGER